MTTPKYKSAPARNPFPRRRRWLLERLSQADGPSYDALCREVVERFGQDGRRWLASRDGVRAVRLLLWDRLATIEPDESVYLTPVGWGAAGNGES